MKINIEIGDKLLNEVLSQNPNKSTKEIVEEALKLLVRVKKQGDLKKLKGKIKWEKNW